MRGPFLPAYLRGTMHWTEALTRKITATVKLVGATINCGGGYFHPDPQPHVQSYTVAMDAVSHPSGCPGMIPLFVGCSDVPNSVLGHFHTVWADVACAASSGLLILDDLGSSNVNRIL